MVKFNKKKNSMYIIEIIAKFFLNRKTKKFSIIEEIEFEEENESCEHIYIAIDSTKDYFACTKCGNVIKNNLKPEKINIFKL